VGHEGIHALFVSDAFASKLEKQIYGNRGMTRGRQASVLASACLINPRDLSVQLVVQSHLLSYKS
jgi:hypothetical protein